MKKNQVKLSVAGSGKTWGLCEDALRNNKESILIISFTRKAVNNIKETLLKQNWGFKVKNIEVISWYDFLLFHFIYPFQYKLDSHIKRVCFDYEEEDNMKLIDNYCEIRNDYISEYICKSTLLKNGIDRLDSIYDKIYIDEIQDLAGYDINILSELLDSSLDLYLVGDPKQSIYKTHNSKKNRGKSGANISKLFFEKNIAINYLNETRRCYPKICDYANFMDPSPPMMKYFKSDENCSQVDYGVFLMDIENFKKYYSSESDIKLLKYDKNTFTYSFNATNIGLIKGKTYKKVAIFPTKKMLKFFKADDMSKRYNNKIYIGVTRAISTVIFIVDNVIHDSIYFKKEKLLLNDTDILCYKFKSPRKFFKNLTKNKLEINKDNLNNSQEIIGVLRKIISINKGKKLYFEYGSMLEYEICIVVFDNTCRDISSMKEGSVYRITGKLKVFNREEQIIVEKKDSLELIRTV